MKEDQPKDKTTDYTWDNIQGETPLELLGQRMITPEVRETIETLETMNTEKLRELGVHNITEFLALIVLNITAPAENNIYPLVGLETKVHLYEEGLMRQRKAAKKLLEIWKKKGLL